MSPANPGDGRDAASEATEAPEGREETRISHALIGAVNYLLALGSYVAMRVFTSLPYEIEALVAAALFVIIKLTVQRRTEGDERGSLIAAAGLAALGLLISAPLFAGLVALGEGTIPAFALTLLALAATCDLARLLALLRGRIHPSARLGITLMLKASFALGMIAIFALSLRAPDRPSEPQLVGAPPTLGQLNRSIALAEKYADGLFRSLGPEHRRMAVLSEYYGVPIWARFSGQRRRVLPGREEVVAKRGRQRFAAESNKLTFEPTLSAQRAAINYRIRYRPQGIELKLTLHELRLFGDERVSFYLGRHRLAEWGQGDRGEIARARFPFEQAPKLLRSVRYTLRHGAQMGHSFYRLRGDQDRARALALTLRRSGYEPTLDIYAPLFGHGVRWRNDFFFSEAAYPECGLEQEGPVGSSFYPYSSKICRISPALYVWASGGDSLVPTLQAIDILRKYGDPSREYRSLDEVERTPREWAAGMEQLYNEGTLGIPRCVYVGCERNYSSGIRTAAFVSLESELGYGHDDQTSRRFADAGARLLIEAQVGRDGLIETGFGQPIYRPLQRGAFFIYWDEQLQNIARRGKLPRMVNSTVESFGANREYPGLLSSNIETTLAGWAALVRYRCLRFEVGCSSALGRDGRSHEYRG